MNIKSLLIGSAAAFAAVSGAQAADAIVAAEPEPMEYVRVCDAFGTGFFYIPGTETCLKIGGFVRFQTSFGPNQSGASDWDAFTKAQVNFDARNDTELGTLRSYIAFEVDSQNDIDQWGNNRTAFGIPYFDARNNADGDFHVDEAYIELGGFKAGFFYSWWDGGINGETDVNGNVTEFNSIAYNYDGGTWRAGISLDELENTDVADGTLAKNLGHNNLGVAGTVGFSLGGVNLDILGGYDNGAEEGAVRAILSADLGPGTLQVLGVWASDRSAYWNASEWSIAASYAFKATDKLTITPAAQYFGDRNFDFAGSPDRWKVGLTVGYQIVDGLAFLGTVNYQRDDVLAGGHTDATTGFLRLQRNF